MTAQIVLDAMPFDREVTVNDIRNRMPVKMKSQQITRCLKEYRDLGIVTSSPLPNGKQAYVRRS